MLVVDALGKDHRHIRIIRRHGPDLVQRLVVAPSSKDEPGPAEGGLAFFPNAGLSWGGGGHTAMPSWRMMSFAAVLRRRWFQTGSQTTAIVTESMSGSRNRRERMSSWIMSMAGQPIAVYVICRFADRVMAS